MFDAAQAQRRVTEALEIFPDDPSGPTEDRAAGGFAQLQRMAELVEAKRLRWLADQDRRASFRRDGYLSSAACGPTGSRWRLARPRSRSGWPRPWRRCPRSGRRSLRERWTSGAVRVLAEARSEHTEAFGSAEAVLV